MRVVAQIAYLSACQRVCISHTFGVMRKTLTSLKASDLQRIGVSKPYAHQLVARDRTPSLELAVRIEQELGIPPKAWLQAANDAAPQSEAA